MKSPKRTVAQEVEDLKQTIARLSEQIHVLTLAMDALTDEIQWRNNQYADRHRERPMTIVTSMPKDPTAKDWHLNRLTAADLPPAAPSTPTGERTLF